VDQRAVGQFHPVRLVAVGEAPADRGGGVPGAFAVDADGEAVEQLGDGQSREDSAGADRDRLGWLPQFQCAGEEDIAPGGR